MIDARRRPSPDASLTGTEWDILRLAALGHSSREIAGQRGVSINTIRNERDKIHHKLGAATLVEALSAVGWLVVPDA